MTESQEDPSDIYDDLEPLPAEAELVDLPDDVVEVEGLEAEASAPAPVVPPQPVPATRPARVAAQPQQSAAKPVAAAAAKPAAVTPASPSSKPVAKPAVTPAVKPSSSGSRRERAEREAEQRKSKKKSNHWVRWPGPGEKPKRELEKAPAVLKKAALGLLIGCLLPWGGYTPFWAGNIGEKLLVLLGLYLWHQSHLLRDGAKVPGFITKLGAKSFIPLFVLAGVFTLIGFMPILSMGSLSGEAMKENLGPFAEKGFLILAGLTLTHIYDYEHGGKFNPLFPIMFLAPGIAGVMALLKVFSADPIGVGHILGGVGAILVGVAGWMSAYTLYVAMKEAKAHGDAKKKLAAEARKEAREQRKR